MIFVKEVGERKQQQHETRRKIVPRLEKRELDLGIGAALLKKIGWTEGSGLGKDGQGVVRPIVPEVLANKAGLEFRPTSVEKKKEGKKNVPPVSVACEECGDMVQGRKDMKEHMLKHRREAKRKKRKNRDDDEEDDEDDKEKDSKEEVQEVQEDAGQNNENRVVVGSKLPHAAAAAVAPAAKILKRGFVAPRRIG